MTQRLYETTINTNQKVHSMTTLTALRGKLYAVMQRRSQCQISKLWASDIAVVNRNNTRSIEEQCKLSVEN